MRESVAFCGGMGWKKKHYGRYKRGGTKKEFQQAGGRDLKGGRKEFDKDLEWILKEIIVDITTYL